MSLALVLSLSLAASPLDLPTWNAQRLQTQGIGLGVLGGWAVANLGVGTVGALLAKDDSTRWFHLGNLLWNTVNLGLSVVGLATQWKTDPASFDAKQSLEASNSSTTIYGVNAGLDVGYIATGAFLWQRGDAKSDARMVGVGQALVIQGAALLIFDTVMAVLHGMLTTRLLGGVDITPRP
jgi:hypothetical protein